MLSARQSTGEAVTDETPGTGHGRVARLEHRPRHQNVSGSIPGRGVYKRQLMFLSHTHVFLFSLPFLSIFKVVSSDEDLKKNCF